MDNYINYLCCKYQLTRAYNALYTGVLILANQIQAHVHVPAGLYFLIYQCIDVQILVKISKATAEILHCTAFLFITFNQ
jgi:hypothetical protein